MGSDISEMLVQTASATDGEGLAPEPASEPAQETDEDEVWVTQGFGQPNKTLPSAWLQNFTGSPGPAPASVVTPPPSLATATAAAVAMAAAGPPVASAKGATDFRARVHGNQLDGGSPLSYVPLCSACFVLLLVYGRSQGRSRSKQRGGGCAARSEPRERARLVGRRGGGGSKALGKSKDAPIRSDQPSRWSTSGHHANGHHANGHHANGPATECDVESHHEITTPPAATASSYGAPRQAASSSAAAQRRAVRLRRLETIGGTDSAVAFKSS
eukprot:SAG11_NODE_5796_length_1462_cov_1.078503_1_plen_272_part_00